MGAAEVKRGHSLVAHERRLDERKPIAIAGSH
jgi:hypothetical protein